MHLFILVFLFTIFLQANPVTAGMSEAFLTNLAAILISISLVVTAVGGFILGIRNSRKTKEIKAEVQEVKKIINGGEKPKDTKVVGRFEGTVEPPEEEKP